MKRVITIVMDSVGIGELPDAKAYHDEGSNTLEHTAQFVKGLPLPNLESLGLGKLVNLHYPAANTAPIKGCYGKMAEKSAGKDTTNGHWEMMGVITTRPMPTYPNGFPKELIAEFEKRVGRKALGNKTASGTEIIKELGEEHVKTGNLIVYTSADSVFQIAAHEEVVPLEKLYEICKAARELLQGEHAVGRVIARPFIGKPGNFTRTHHRHDYSLEPAGETALDRIKKHGLDTISIGKIWDIFAGRGIAKKMDAGPNAEVMQKIVEGIRSPDFKNGLLFANLVDFDMLYNHRQDPGGFANAMKEFDKFLPQILAALKDDDVLMITADHGNDPTDQSTDHCREYVPILVYGKKIKTGVDLGIRKTFADCGQTVLDILELPLLEAGTSFKKEIFS